MEQHDPVLRLARDVVAGGAAQKAELLKLDAEVKRKMAAAEKFAVDSPFPEAQSAFAHVFA